MRASCFSFLKILPVSIKVLLSLVGTVLFLLITPMICNYVAVLSVPATGDALLRQGVLHIPWTINQKSAAEFDAALRNNKANIVSVEADSGGGDPEAAATIARLIKDAGLTVAVPSRGICASSCVRILVDSGSPKIADDGYLLFHAGRWSAQNNAYDCTFCRYVSMPIAWVIDQFPRVLVGDLMRTWSSQISSNLDVFLRGCSDDPLQTHNGIVLSGRQLREIMASNSAIRCDQIKTQDARWYLENVRLEQRVNLEHNAKD